MTCALELSGMAEIGAYDKLQVRFKAYVLLQALDHSLWPILLLLGQCRGRRLIDSPAVALLECKHSCTRTPVQERDAIT